jgi:hypothetical protein
MRRFFVAEWFGRGRSPMSFVHLEFEALKILTALEDMNSARTVTAMAAARALADALADAAEAGDGAAKVEA